MTHHRDTIDWSSQQRLYLEALQALFSGSVAASQGENPGDVWIRALDDWWSGTAGTLPGQNRELVDTLLRQVRNYYRLNDQFALMLRELAGAGDDWSGVLDDHIRRMQELVTTDARHRQTSAAVQDPLTGIWRTLQSFATGTAEHSAPQDLFRSMMDSIPALGPTREYQQQIDAARRLWIRHLETEQAWQSLHASMAVDALDLFRTRILALAAEGGKITSLRQIFDLWIEANETIHAGRVKSAGYAECYAAVVNSLMALRQQFNGMTDEVLAAMNLPTARGVRTLQERQHRLRVDLRLTREQQRRTDEALDSLRADLDMLQDPARDGRARQGDVTPVKKKRKRTAQSGKPAGKSS